MLYGVMLMPSLTLMPRNVAALVAHKSAEQMAAKIETVACANVAVTDRTTSSTVKHVYQMMN